MESKKLKTISLVSLIISVIPAATLFFVFLKTMLPEGIRTTWTGVNIACAVVGLLLSIICVKSDESRSPVNISSTIISAFWCLLIIGIVVLALFLSFLL